MKTSPPLWFGGFNAWNQQLLMAAEVIDQAVDWTWPLRRAVCVNLSLVADQTAIGRTFMVQSETSLEVAPTTLAQNAGRTS